jgi:methylated-DNA-protein-cysteine methyltransferase-like protein
MDKTSRCFEQVYAVTAAIPAGKVATYGQIAALIGGLFSPKIVGFALSRAPACLPCHRVIHKAGTMTPGTLFGGAERQRRLLEREGVIFLPDGRVDMDVSLCDPAALLQVRRQDTLDD